MRHDVKKNDPRHPGLEAEAIGGSHLVCCVHRQQSFRRHTPRSGVVTTEHVRFHQQRPGDERGGHPRGC